MSVTIGMVTGYGRLKVCASAFHVVRVGWGATVTMAGFGTVGRVPVYDDPRAARVALAPCQLERADAGCV
jgi:hypothetical protein